MFGPRYTDFCLKVSENGKLIGKIVTLRRHWPHNRANSFWIGIKALFPSTGQCFPCAVFNSTSTPLGDAKLRPRYRPLRLAGSGAWGRAGDTHIYEAK